MAQKLSLKHWPTEITPRLANPASLAQSVHIQGKTKAVLSVLFQNVTASDIKPFIARTIQLL